MVFDELNWKPNIRIHERKLNIESHMRKRRERDWDRGGEATIEAIRRSRGRTREERKRSETYNILDSDALGVFKMQLSCFFTGTLAMALTICTGELMAEVLLFRGKKFTATNTFTLPGDRLNCSQEIKIFSNLTGNLPQRLVSCPDSKLWTTDVSTGITNSETKMNYSLEHVSLNCSRQIISGYNHQSEIEWQASLQITALMADPGPPFDEIRFEIICSCMDCSGLKFRQAEVYFVKQAESNKTSPTWKPSTAGTTVTDLSLNSTLPTPTPPSTEHHDADHKNNLGMIIGIPVASVLVLVVVFALVRYRYKINRIIQIKINRCFVRQNNNTTAESIDI